MIVSGIAPQEPRPKRECSPRIIQQLWLYLSQFEINCAIETCKIHRPIIVGQGQGCLCGAISGHSYSFHIDTEHIVFNLARSDRHLPNTLNTPRLASRSPCRSKTGQVKMVHSESRLTSSPIFNWKSPDTKAARDSYISSGLRKGERDRLITSMRVAPLHTTPYGQEHMCSERSGCWCCEGESKSSKLPLGEYYATR